MASGITLSFLPARMPQNAGRSREDRKRRAGGNGGAAWWSPLFGWGAEPDYIQRDDATSPEKAAATDPAMEGGRRRYGALTEEKARELRMRIMETESFHDAMYHSAIASRLASDVRGRSRP